MYISLDVETGGIGLDKSLLTLGYVVANDNFEVQDEIEWAYIPDDGIYHVDPKGMEINGIDLVDLSKKAISYKKGGQELYRDLGKWFRVNCGERLIVVGKNVWGDCLHIWDKLMKRETWEIFVSYRQFDLTAAHMMLRAAGKIPADNKGSLKTLCEYYGIQIEGLHDALADAKMTLKVIERMVEEIR